MRNIGAGLPATIGPMWPCHCCPSAHGGPSHDFAVNSNVISRPCPTHETSQWSDISSNTGPWGNQRQRTDDSSYHQAGSVFTDHQLSLLDGKHCHQARKNNSHATYGINRKRYAASNRQALAPLSSNRNEATEMQDSWQQPNHAFGSFSDYMQPTISNFSLSNSSRLQGRSNVGQFQRRQSSNLTFHQLLDVQIPQPAHSAEGQTPRYVSFDPLSQYRPSYSPHEASLTRFNTIGSPQFARTSVSTPPYVKEDPDDPLLQIINEQYGASSQGETNFGVCHPFPTPPLTALGPASEHLGSFDPEADTLPPWDFPDLNSYRLDDESLLRSGIDHKYAEEAKYQTPNQVGAYDEVSLGSDTFDSWEGTNFGVEGLPDANQLHHGYQSLEDTKVRDVNCYPALPTQVDLEPQNSNPILSAWASDDQNPSLEVSATGPLDLHQSYDASRSEPHSSEPPSLTSSSKWHRRDRTLGYRDEYKDQLLIQWKQQGMSYKKIKIRGQFEEAESTLRGRYRTLTKPKEARVRKPEWQEQDIHNLLLAVDRFSQNNQYGQLRARQRYSPYSRQQPPRQDAGKIPWKQVAEYMEELGSYRFGNATVKKKYLEVVVGEAA